MFLKARTDVVCSCRGEVMPLDKAAPDAEWMYHTTSKAIAKKIKTQGLKSALLRIGRAAAAPTGAFAKDRQKHEQKECLNRAIEIIRALSGAPHKLTLEEIGDSEVPYDPFDFKCSGSVDDNGKLEKLKKQMIVAYAKDLLKVRQAAKKDKQGPANKPTPVNKDTTARLAEVLLGIEQVQYNSAKWAQVVTKFEEGSANRNHYVVRFAVQLMAYKYLIEEEITSSHIYFLKPECAEDGYKDYTKNVPKADRVVLRVRKDVIPPKELLPDESEGRALMTRVAVKPEDIEIIDEAEQFISDDYRCDAVNWDSIKAWKG